MNDCPRQNPAYRPTQFSERDARTPYALGFRHQVKVLSRKRLLASISNRYTSSSDLFVAS